MIYLGVEELFFLLDEYYKFILVAVVALVVTFLVYIALRSETNGIPGRLGLPILGETLAFLSATNSTKGCYEFVRQRRSWNGKWFKTRIFGKVHVFVPTTEGAKHILNNDLLFNKGYLKSMADCIGKKSLFCAPPESHKRIRHLLADPFSMNSMHVFVEKFDKMLLQRLKKLESSRTSFKVLDFSMKIIFDAMCSMLLSITDDTLLTEIDRDTTCVSDAILSIPIMIPGFRYYKAIKARKRLMERFKEIIDRRKSGIECHDDFLQTMLSRDSYQSSEKLDDSEIMENILTLIISGRTTSAASMMWSVKYLDSNREALAMLRAEQLAIFKMKEDGYSLSLEDVKSMSYGLKVVKETLRMANGVLWYPRVALNNCKIEGFEIKKGWHLDVDATCIHNDPELYKDPLQFNPSRFDEMQKPYSFIPFGAGPRACLGINMAKVTMLVFLHRLTGGYKWTVVDPDSSLERKAHIPRLRSGLPITLKPLKRGSGHEHGSDMTYEISHLNLNKGAADDEAWS